MRKSTPQKRRASRKKGAPGYAFKATYHRNETALKSPSRRWRTYLGTVVLAGALTGFGWLSYIDTIEVEASDDVQLAEQIERSAAERYMFQWQVTPESLGELAQEYKGSVVSLDSKVQWQRRALFIVVETRQPVLQWRSGEDTYLIDTSGTVLSSREQMELPVVEDGAKLPVETGQQIATRQFVDFVLGVVSSDLQWSHIKVLETTSELYVEVDNGVSVRFATTEDLDIQLSNLKRVRAHAKANDESIREYIDLRLPYKAYYR